MNSYLPDYSIRGLPRVVPLKHLSLNRPLALIDIWVLMGFFSVIRKVSKWFFSFKNKMTFQVISSNEIRVSLPNHQRGEQWQLA